jgi:hypothetical protein
MTVLLIRHREERSDVAISSRRIATPLNLKQLDHRPL